MKFSTYAAPTVLGLFFSFMGLMYAITGGVKAAYLIGGLLLLAYAGAISYVIKKAKEGEGSESAYVLMLPMFMVSAMQIVYSIGSYSVSYTLPDSEAFSSECATAGVQYLKPPTLPVHSIAYVYETKHEPHFTSYSVSGGTRISSLSYYNPPDHPALEFVEAGPFPVDNKFSHKPKVGKGYSIDALTADVLVKVNMSPEEELRKALGSQGIVKYELIVIDRRTNEKLASLRYVTDAKNRRACGLTGEKVLSESSFILKAIGLQ